VFDGQRLPAKEQTEIKRRKYVQRDKLFMNLKKPGLFCLKIALSSKNIDKITINSELE